MNIVLLSGGSGTRLWPLSNGIRSKQFLKIFKREDGGRESMLERMFRMILKTDSDANILIATTKEQIPQIKNRLGTEVKISPEPCRKDTFPAISLAAAYLKKSGLPESAPVIVCPVDPDVEEDYFQCLKEMSAEAAKGNAKLTLMGIVPTYPSTKYGYIIPEENAEISPVKMFREKPDEETARQYLAEGALWNGGIFAFQLGYVLQIAKQEFGFCDYEKIVSEYSRLPKISFDYAVAEKEKEIQVIRFHGRWKDLGTWNTLPEAMSEEISGNSLAVDCDNTHIINELSVPLIAMGIRNSVIVASPDGILVTDKEKSAQLKSYAEKKALRPMYEKREWGEYRIIDYTLHPNGNNSLVKEIQIKAGKSFSYHLHEHRNEVWTITSGDGIFLLEGEKKEVRFGDVLSISKGRKHSLKAKTDMQIIEVQFGEIFSEEDTLQFADPTD